MLTAIIVAAGDSRRMGFDKLFAAIASKPVIAHTISAFQRANSGKIDKMKSKRLFAIEGPRRSGRSFRVANTGRIPSAPAWIGWTQLHVGSQSMTPRAH